MPNHALQAASWQASKPTGWVSQVVDSKDGHGFGEAQRGRSRHEEESTHLPVRIPEVPPPPLVSEQVPLPMLVSLQALRQSFLDLCVNSN